MNWLPLVAFALSQAGAAPPPPSTASAAISGIVVKQASGDPLPGARVQLFKEPPAIAPPGSYVADTTSRDNGQFSFDRLQPGPYWIVATFQGYMPAEYGQRSPTGQGIPRVLAPGQKAANIQLSLAPTGSITGRIVDAEGDPVPRVQVQALHSVYRDGQRGLTITQTVVSDDRGAYRLFWLPPGEYRIAATPLPAPDSAGARSPFGVESPSYITPPRRFATHEQATPRATMAKMLDSGETVEEVFVPVYFPGTTDAATASAVEVGPGSAITGIDVPLADNRARAFHIRGVLVGMTGLPTGGVAIQAVSRAAGPNTTMARTQTSRDGSFDLAGLPAGSYYLTESAGGAGVVPVEIPSADVDNVTIASGTGLTIPVRITVEDGGGSKEPPGDLFLQLRRDPDILGVQAGVMLFSTAATSNTQLGMNGVSPGDYRLSVGPLNVDPQEMARPRPPALERAYVKSIRLGNADVLADGLHLWSAPQGTLEIVIRSDGASVEGIVTDDRRQPVANATVVLVPDAASRRRLDLYKTASTDGTGRFGLLGIAPGDYSLFAFDDVEQGAWMNQEFMRPFENRGRYLRVGEGGSEHVDVTVIAR